MNTRSIRIDVRQSFPSRVNVTVTLSEDGKPLLQKRFSRKVNDGRPLDQLAALMLLTGVKTQVENWLALIPLFAA